MLSYARPFSSLNVSHTNLNGSQLTSRFPLSLNRHKRKVNQPLKSFSRSFGTASGRDSTGWEPILGSLPLASPTTIGTVNLLLTANHPSSFVTKEFVNKHQLVVESMGKEIRVLGDVVVDRAAWVPLLLETPTKRVGLGLNCLVLPEEYLNSMLPLNPKIDMTLGIIDLFELKGVLDYGERSLVITLDGGLKFKLQATGRCLPFHITCLNTR